MRSIADTRPWIRKPATRERAATCRGRTDERTGAPRRAATRSVARGAPTEPAREVCQLAPGLPSVGRLSRRAAPSVANAARSAVARSATCGSRSNELCSAAIRTVSVRPRSSADQPAASGFASASTYVGPSVERRRVVPPGDELGLVEEGVEVLLAAVPQHTRAVGAHPLRDVVAPRHTRGHDPPDGPGEPRWHGGADRGVPVLARLEPAEVLPDPRRGSAAGRCPAARRGRPAPPPR